MKRLRAVALAVTFGALMAPTEATAQVSIRVGGAATFPFGDGVDDYGSYADAGWMVAAGFNVPLDEEGLGVGGHGFFGTNGDSAADGDKADLYGLLGTVTYTISTDRSIAPHAFAALGFMTHASRSDSNPGLDVSVSGLAWGAGVGIGFPIRSIGGAIDAFYLSGTGDDLGGTKLFGVEAIIRIPLTGAL